MALVQIESARAQVAQMIVNPSNSSTASAAAGPSGKTPIPQVSWQLLLVVISIVFPFPEKHGISPLQRGWFSCPACAVGGLLVNAKLLGVSCYRCCCVNGVHSTDAASPGCYFSKAS